LGGDAAAFAYRVGGVRMSVFLQLVGLAAITAGCALVSLPVGLIVAGVASLLLGALMERDTPQTGQ
jgi:ammonia channel protein AmtB